MSDNIAKIFDFKKEVTKAENYLLNLPQVELPVKHYFVNGLYARELFIPKGTILTGAIHKTEHLCVMTGDIEIRSEQCGGRYTGYQMFVSTPGVKRIGYALEDTTFTTLHPTDETDISELEKLLVVQTYEEYEQYLLVNEGNTNQQIEAGE